MDSPSNTSCHSSIRLSRPMSFFASQRIKNEGLLESYFIYYGKTLKWEVFCRLDFRVMFISQHYGIHKAKKKSTSNGKIQKWIFFAISSFAIINEIASVQPTFILLHRIVLSGLLARQYYIQVLRVNLGRLNTKL